MFGREVGIRLQGMGGPFALSRAEVDEKTCTACGICGDRCPVSAMKVNGGVTVDRGLCLGCGVCVPTCQTKSVTLVRRATAK